MSVANQKIVRNEVRNFDNGKANPFGRIHKCAMESAMINLDNIGAFKLYCMFSMNSDTFSLELSQKYCADIGIKKDSYYQGIKTLINKGYLTQGESMNQYVFHEFPQKESFSAQQNRNSVEQKENSDRQKKYSAEQKEFSDKPQRNTIDTTKNTINTKIISEPFSIENASFIPATKDIIKISKEKFDSMDIQADLIKQDLYFIKSTGKYIQIV